jgi:5-methylcytosine-specific restriction endonuclease McrA
MGLIKQQNEHEYILTEVPYLIGGESESAERVRRFRGKKALTDPQAEKKEPKSNALRQKQHRAKKKCEEKQHIPYIEDYINNKRYNGNYYVVIQRDKYKCALCGSIENLCVHHIDGYNEEKPQNSNTNKMITLCRTCHSNIHAGQAIDEDTLDAIDYYIESNETLPSNDEVTPSNKLVTSCNTEIEKEKDIEKELEKEGEKSKKVDYELVARMYNDTCVSFPRITTLSDARKKAIKARLNKYSLEDLQRLFTLAEASDFLKGDNKRNWSANFDWLIKDSNIAKVLDGNYNNKTNNNQYKTNTTAQELDDFYNMASNWAESEG